MIGSDYVIETKVEAGFLWVRAAGRYKLARSMSMIRFVRELAERHGVTRVLLDTTAVPQPIPDMERYTLAMAAVENWRGLKVAGIDSTEPPEGFFENVAVNRGARVRVFGSETQALEWLLDPRT